VPTLKSRLNYLLLTTILMTAINCRAIIMHYILMEQFVTWSSRRCILFRLFINR